MTAPFSMPALAYIYTATLFKHNNNLLPLPQTIIALGDYHDKSNSANNIQKEAFLQIITNQNRDSIKIVTEDLSSVNNQGYGVCCSHTIQNNGGFLARLTDELRKQSIEVDNVEYRFCRVIGLGCLIKKIDNHDQTTPSGVAIPLKKIYKEIASTMNEVSHYNDYHQANKLYKNAIETVKKGCAALRLNQNNDISIQEYCKKIPAHAYQKTIEQLCMFDSCLLDAKILHSIISTQKPIVILAVGASHIRQLIPILKSLQYKQENLSRMQKTSTKAPTPVDITIIKKALTGYTHSSSSS